jgi:hypothetical protein
MKNITASVPDRVYRDAGICAAERCMSLSGLVSEHLRSISEQEADFSRLETQQTQVMAEIAGFSARDRLARDEIHRSCAS